MVQNVQNNGKSHTAEHHQHHNREIDYRIRDERFDGVGKSERIKARVAEGGDRHEHGLKQTLTVAVFRNEAKGENDCGRALQKKRNNDGVAYQLHQPLQRIGIEGFLNQQTFPQRNTLADHQKYQ